VSPRPNSVRVIHGGPVSAPRSDRGGEDSAQDGGARTIGRYALHTEIAAGGMATVHIGRLLGPVGFARTVAIKKLHPPLAKDPEFVAMFLDEARLAARIRHPNVVSTLDVVATEGELFVVMEYVPGESLARLLRAVRTNNEMVPVPIAATIMVGVLHGLHAAHEARDERGEPLRIVHRDVSPHNILVGTDGDAHVIDFGIAKARGRMQVTRQGQIKGKLSYMPAEQLLGQALDHRADVFAASIVLWEALTGQRLFQGVDDGDVYAKVLLGKVDPPSLHARELSPAIDEIVMRGLARDRTQRFATAREMALALEAAIPLAPPSQVGRWVEGLVGDSLAERTEQIAGIERLDDAGETRMTSSALMSIGGSGIAPAAEPGPKPSPGGTLVSRIDRTAPTQPIGLLAAVGKDPQVTIVDRPDRPATDEGSIGAVAGRLPRRSRRVFLIAVLLLIPIASFGAWRRNWRGNAGYASVPSTLRPPEPAAPSAMAPAARTATDWIPVPVAPSQAETAIAMTPAGSAHKTASAQATPMAKPALPRSPTAPQASEGAETTAAPPAPRTNGASCDPPFWIDGDGTKRYNRHCANL
jgi:eukaryotic-like serine/threonine-protein kinase